MKSILWKPKKYHYTNSNIANYISYVNKKYNKSITDYDDLYNWSIDEIENFWESFFIFSKIKSSKYSSVLTNPSSMLDSYWFDGAKLNFAENLLKYRDKKIAIEFSCEDKRAGSLTYEQLYEQAKSLAFYLKKSGIKKGDRVAALMPNIPETVIAMLATSWIGAVWSSCSPDFGINGVLDRFTQINPKILFTCNGYFYKGKTIDLNSKILNIKKKLKSLKSVVSLDLVDTEIIEGSINWNNIVHFKDKNVDFTQVSFSEPLYIMYSSGTTGKPKSIVHSVGGTLIQHLKELSLHTDVKRTDSILYFTTCGWMMWNWLVSSLALGATIVLYDGNPFYPNKESLLKIVDNLKVSIFGTSAKYISYLEQENIKPSTFFKFKNLKTVLSTGSPLVEENYEFVYNNWSKDIQLSSISGGTDIISCFALGVPIKPVVSGRLQSLGLGMSVKSYDKHGNPKILKKGELICDKPFPSMPIYFLNDEQKNLYKKAYFEVYKNIWTHGDYISIYKDGTVKIFGRSDTTLNPGGVRIGTAEIYRVLDTFKIIDDSIVVGYNHNNDDLVILFVKMINSSLTKNIAKQIRLKISTDCSPRHIPFRIIQIKDIPYTLNGKKVEISVRNILAGKKITNLDALANPECLSYYKDIDIKKEEKW
jgi:acetoacetyl-CoA synthetase